MCDECDKSPNVSDRSMSELALNMSGLAAEQDNGGQDNDGQDNGGSQKPGGTLDDTVPMYTPYEVRQWPS